MVVIDNDDPLLGEEAQRRAAARRNVGVIAGSVVLSLVLVVAVLDAVRLVDAYGVDSDTVRASVGDRSVEVKYPTLSRPGLASPFEITVEQQGGFDEDIEVVINRHYFALWDFNSVVPAPSEETGDDETVLWTFTSPTEGEVFRVQWDARIEPARQRGEEGRVAVLDSSGIEAVAVEFTTNIRP